ncbi:MAG: PAS domain S-box protein, partial [Spirochaetota bacterium]
ELARRLGGPMVVVHPAPAAPEGHTITPDQRRERLDPLRQSLVELAELGEQLGVVYLVENLPGHYWVGNDPVKLAELLREVGSPWVRMCFDTGHARVVGPVPGMLAHCRDVISYLHVHDNDGRRDNHLMPGDGSIRWVKMDAKVIVRRDGSVEQIYGAYQSVTELRETQGRLAQREFEFAQIVQTVRQGIWVGDAEGICIYVNQALCELTGYPRDQLVGGRSLATVLSGAPDEPPDAPFESELAGRDGGVTPVLVTPRVIRGDGDEYRGSFYLFADISSQRRAMDVLERGRRKLEEVFHASPAPSLLIDAATNAVIDVNDAFTTMTGFPAEEIVGTGGFGLAEYEKLEDLNRMVAILKERSEHSSQVRLRTKEGEPRLFDVDVRDVVVEDEEVLLLILTPPQ